MRNSSRASASRSSRSAISSVAAGTQRGSASRAALKRALRNSRSRVGRPSGDRHSSPTSSGNRAHSRPRERSSSAARSGARDSASESDACTYRRRTQDEFQEAPVHACVVRGGQRLHHLRAVRMRQAALCVCCKGALVTHVQCHDRAEGGRVQQRVHYAAVKRLPCDVTTSVLRQSQVPCASARAYGFKRAHAAACSRAEAACAHALYWLARPRQRKCSRRATEQHSATAGDAP